MEKTVVLIKPDGVQKKYVGEIISRLEKKGFTMVSGKLVMLNESLLRTWYAHHVDKPFFPDIVSYMTSGPVMAMIWEGDNVVSVVREMAGVTDSSKADKGTIRGDLGEDIQRNVVHISDAVESAQKEIGLLFTPQDILE
ncbi:nucleoside-diphosphate kinase [Candidatus Roizmanbacteria bacterium CG_4_10_14_0_2_um_filter_39_13]|uniref:Nucleoside diphosphate kinase n=1 Tax=Candidatus Roizmanbacteria bacterium CG_4_10_14_0_2_um_filter_39_13 TaxID=1974825 RepID=A0A2M7TZI3_9BACT|nr:MAG: nucleoside-diphosphate kinase [Candidatus Roizmanbacteria bacterium CG_4_10_14_0_2_um_filter_39_13]